MSRIWKTKDIKPTKPLTVVETIHSLERIKEFFSEDYDRNTIDQAISWIRCFEQVNWERSVAEQQLAEIGKSLGEKMDDIKDMIHNYEDDLK